ncbi:MAG: zf-HC2 domain-containing protein [Rubrobacteraceae bacterium]
MSVHHDAGCNCDPETVFGLADRALAPGDEREARRHLDECPECRGLYEREMRLSECLGSLRYAEPKRASVCQSVAMALPTRPMKARILWSAMALGLLATALFALVSQGANPATSAADAVEAFQGMAVMLTDVFGAALAAAGSLVLVALALGAALDLLLVAVLYAVSRRRSGAREV